MNLGSHHLHLRKRMYQNLEPFPNPDKLKRNFDRLMFVVGTLAPLALLPQVIHIFVNHNASGLSIWTWIPLTCINTLWTIYGALHRERPILIANFGMTVFDLCTILGIVLFH